MVVAVPPSWVRTLPAQHWPAWRQALVDAVARETPDAEVDEHAGMLRLADDAIELAPLAEACAAEHDAGGWTEQLRAMLRTLVEGRRVAAELLADPVRARDALRLVLTPADEEIEGQPADVRRPALPDLDRVLVVATGDLVVTVPPDAAKTLGATEELFALAAERTRQHERPEVTEVAVGDAATITVLSGSPFAASVALDPSEFVAVGEAGALVALPAQDLALIYGLGGPGGHAALGELLVQARQHHEAGPDPLTDDVFWCHDGRWEVVPVELDMGTFHVRPSETLLEVLDAKREA